MTFDTMNDIKVVELAMYAFAPSCAAVLADWGADVVKIVPPRGGDPLMSPKGLGGVPDRDVGIAPMWEQLNRGKRCIALDVSQPDGRALLFRLLADADVFVTNLLPDARRRFGVDVADVRAANPRLIYARASGHGDRGPEREQGGYDHTDFWARSGIAHAASSVSDEFVPQPGPAMGDAASGAFMAGAVAAALFRRERTGAPAVIDVSLLSAAAWMFAPSIVAAEVYAIDTVPRRRHADLAHPMVAAYTTRDGRQVYLAGVRTDGQFEQFARAIGHEELLGDPLFAGNAAREANARACIAALDRIFAARDLADWIPLLRGIGTPWSVVQTAREAAHDAQVVANGYVMQTAGRTGSYPLIASPAQFDGDLPSATRAPGHGEHTDAVLGALGLDAAELARLRAAGIVA